MEVNTVVTYRETRTSVFGPEYSKINGVFKRNMEEKGVIIPDQFSQEEFEYLLDNEWTWTEKVDGTNIRLHFNGESITVGGRTDSAQIPGGLMFALGPFNNPPLWGKVFDPEEVALRTDMDVTIYGEGYGPKIQNGGRYAKDPQFIVFDIKVGRWWLKREDVINIAEQLGMKVVPVVARCSLRAAIKYTEAAAPSNHTSFTSGASDFWSRVATKEQFVMEGIVGTPTVPLFARNGSRIIAKLKVRDFEDLVKHEARRREPSGLEQVMTAVKKARGGDAPTTIEGYA